MTAFGNVSMHWRRFRQALVTSLLAAALSAGSMAAFAQTDAGQATANPSGSRVDESFFAKTLFPVLHAAQCERCHHDNGVASETQLEFPRVDSSEAQITAFGLKLLD